MILQIDDTLSHDRIHIMIHCNFGINTPRYGIIRTPRIGSAFRHLIRIQPPPHTAQTVTQHDDDTLRKYAFRGNVYIYTYHIYNLNQTHNEVFIK